MYQPIIHRSPKWKQIAAEVDFTEALQGMMGDDYSNLRLDLYNLPLNALALRPPKPAPPKNTRAQKGREGKAYAHNYFIV